MINRQLHSLLKIKSKFVDKNAIFSIFNVPILSLLIKSFLLILFLSPTIKNIILNQRKLKFNKQFEKNILHDAIKSKTYEIY